MEISDEKLLEIIDCIDCDWGCPCNYLCAKDNKAKPCLDYFKEWIADKNKSWR